MISRLPQILPNQNTDFVHFLCNNILNWPLNLHGKKKKPYLAKTLTEPIDLMALLSAPNPNANFACNNQRQQLTALWSTAYRHRQNDSTLAQWCWGIQWGRQSYFRVSVPLLITTLLKCSGSTCAHWRPSSWWHSRQPPSLPMPRNGTD